MSSWTMIADLSRSLLSLRCGAKAELAMRSVNRVSMPISVPAEPYEISPNRVTLAEVGGQGVITEIP